MNFPGGEERFIFGTMSNNMSTHLRPPCFCPFIAYPYPHPSPPFPFSQLLVVQFSFGSFGTGPSSEWDDSMEMRFTNCF